MSLIHRGVRGTIRDLKLPALTACTSLARGDVAPDHPVSAPTGRLKSRMHCGSWARIAAASAAILTSLALAASLMPAQGSAALRRQTVTLTPGPGSSFRLPSGTIAYSLTVAPDGTIWFAGERGRFPSVSPVIGRLTTGGMLTTFTPSRAFPSASFSEENVLAIGPEGDLFVPGRKAVGRLSPDGKSASLPIGRGGTTVRSVAAGPDGNLWFTATGLRGPRPWVGTMTPSGQVTFFPVPGGAGQIVAGADALWFTDTDPEGSSLGRILPDGEVTLVPLPGFSPYSLAVGWEGDLWVTGSTETPHGSALARVTPQGQVTQFPAPGDEGTGVIARGPDGDMWFTARGAEPPTIDSITPDGLIGPPACIHGCKLEPFDLATGTDGSLVYAAGHTRPGGGGGGSGLTSSAYQYLLGGTIGVLAP
jgi:streptogramin lyase